MAAIIREEPLLKQLVRTRALRGRDSSASPTRRNLASGKGGVAHRSSSQPPLRQQHNVYQLHILPYNWVYPMATPINSMIAAAPLKKLSSVSQPDLSKLMATPPMATLSRCSTPSTNISPYLSPLNLSRAATPTPTQWTAWPDANNNSSTNKSTCQCPTENACFSSLCCQICKLFPHKGRKSVESAKNANLSAASTTFLPDNFSNLFRPIFASAEVDQITSMAAGSNLSYHGSKRSSAAEITANFRSSGAVLRRSSSINSAQHQLPTAPPAPSVPGSPILGGPNKEQRFLIASFCSASGTNQGAIDNRIEQAMDLVKSHLMNAVRSEVEELKEKIIKLEETISQQQVELSKQQSDMSREIGKLQAENEFLKGHVGPDILVQLSNIQ